MKNSIRNENWFEDTVKEYGSLEKYIAYMSNAGAIDPHIEGYESFQYLLEKGLLKKDDIIRVDFTGGSIDGHFRINAEGKLEGMKDMGERHSGTPGIHNPRELLSLEMADHGWTLGLFAKRRIIRSIETVSQVNL